jgi:hypothetical protein
MKEAAPKPPAAEQPEAVGQEHVSSSAKRYLGTLAATGAAVAVFAAAQVGGAIGFGGAPQERAAEDGVSAPLYRPIANLEDSSSTRPDAIRRSNEQAAVTGHSVDVTVPDPLSQSAFNTYLQDVLALTPQPRLEEVIHVHDINTFGQEVEAYPAKYPFTIYNATREPVDMVFTQYALRATRHWLNEAAADKDGLAIAEHTRVHVRPRVVPHAMVLLGKMPVGVRDKTFEEVQGYTSWYGNLTTSLILQAGGPARPFRRETIATEIAQSLIDTYDESTIPGGHAAQREMEKNIGSFNPPGAHDLDLASQEVITNKLGDVIAATYGGGETAADKPPENAFGQTTPAIDDFVPAFMALKERIAHEHSTIITASGDGTPTARYYRQHQR